MKTYWLSTHLGYRCRHSGACCSSGWPIPIERDRAARVEQGVAALEVRPAVVPWLAPSPPNAPTDVAGMLALQPSGACAFHLGRPAAASCAVHAMRPASCEHFPYICTIDARGVHVTLSHYCPTVAEGLFLDQPAVDIVEGPPLFGDGRLPEGLDAREALPPTTDVAGNERPVGRCDGRARPRRLRLMDWDEVSRWERRLVREVSTAPGDPSSPNVSLFERARAALPQGWSWADPPGDLEAVWSAHVAPAWPSWNEVTGRYLAAKAHASWALHLGRGLADVRLAVDIARAVLQVEAIRACWQPPMRLNATRLKTAIRRCDLLLAHHVDPYRLFGSMA
ncbi:MAG: hypothetical protein OEW19_16670 [Acidobacteriota bacterium]|nr:hypothetical protein [Acidobacteriota bacterium]